MVDSLLSTLRLGDVCQWGHCEVSPGLSHVPHGRPGIFGLARIVAKDLDGFSKTIKLSSCN